MAGECPRPKKNFEKYFSIFFSEEFFFACNLNLHNLYTRDDSLGFEDCRLATHLLNSYHKRSLEWLDMEVKWPWKVPKVCLPDHNTQFSPTSSPLVKG